MTTETNTTAGPGEVSPGRAACEAFWAAVGAGADPQDPTAAWHWALNQKTTRAWEAAAKAAVGTVVSDIDRDPMWHRAYMDVQAVLDKALGTEEEDGAGSGIAGDVALLASQRDEARAELRRLKERTEPCLFPHPEDGQAAEAAP